MRERPSDLDTMFGETEAGSASTSAPGPAGHERERGELLGRYLILDVIGRGGMGAVYAAYDPELDRKVAIKLIASERGAEAGDQQRLLREAQATAQLSHPNVITVYDVGTHRGRVFVAMEFVGGGTLREWIEAGPHPWRAVLERMIAAGRGLAAAHRVGLVHRDFKPANVLIGEDGRLRVADFGLARRMLATSSAPISTRVEQPDKPELLVTIGSLAASNKLTMTGALVGTPAYMAPEQFSGDEVDARADQFGFCVALWEALFGERPFVGDNLAALVLAIEEGRVREPSRSSSVPAWLRRVVRRGLAPSPVDRWPSMDALLAELVRQPARRRLALSLGLGLTLASAAVIGALVLDRDDPPVELCTGADAAFAGTYDEDDRRAIAERFAEGAALATGEVLLPSLDRWAEQWRAQWRDACVATRVRGEQSEELLDRRMTCLERHRRRMATFVELLREAEGELLLDALSGLEGLGSASACERDGSLGVVAPPSDPAKRAEVERLLGELDEVGTLLHVGELERAEARLTTLAPEVAASDWAPLQTELLWLRGDTLGRRHEFAASEQALTEAAEQAIAIGDDRLAIDALVSQARYGGEWEPRTSESLRLLGVARALAARLDDPPDLLCRIELTRGIVQGLDGRSDQAQASAERALVHASQAEPKPGLLTADAEKALAGAYYRSGRYEDGRVHLERAYELLVETLGPNNARLHQIHHLRALYAMAAGRYADAVESFEAQLALTEAHFGSDHLDVSDVLSNLGTAYQKAGRLPEARVALERAVAIRERELGSDNVYVGHSRANLVSVLRDLGLIDEALAQAEQAHAIVLAARGPEHPEMIVMHTIVAELRMASGSWAQAHEHMSAALALVRLPGQTNAHYEFNVLVYLAAIEAELGRPAQALAHLETAEALPGVVPTPEEQSERDWSRARALAARGERDAARELVEQAIVRLEPHPDHAGLVERLRSWRDDAPR